jgi:hypothetical protein
MGAMDPLETPYFRLNSSLIILFIFAVVYKDY